MEVGLFIKKKENLSNLMFFLLFYSLILATTFYAFIAKY